MKQYYPGLWEEIKEYVAAKKFVPVGGTWIEMDGNIPRLFIVATLINVVLLNNLKINFVFIPAEKPSCANSSMASGSSNKNLDFSVPNFGFLILSAIRHKFLR